VGARSDQSSNLSSILVLIGVNAAVALALTVGLELALGDWFASYLPPAFAVVNQSYTGHQNLYDPPGDVLYVRDKYALRGVHEPLASIELVTVGGSTTDQSLISEGHTWQDALRLQLGIRVANAGVDGMSSFGHIVAVSDWLHRLPNFHPKLYLHYIGVNDASLSKTPHRWDRPGEEWGILQIIKRRSFVVGALKKLFRSPERIEVSHKGVTADEATSEMQEVAVDKRPIKGFIEAVYEPNLRKLLALHRERNEAVILVSQTANPAIVRWTSGAAFVSAKHPDLEEWAMALGMINGATERICREGADICRFSDLAARVRFEARDFYDLVHSTPSGAYKIGTFFAKELAPMFRGSLSAVEGREPRVQ